MKRSRDFCPLCLGRDWSIEISSLTILNRWKSDLRRCRTCGTSWFAESQLWKSEAYQDSIVALDTGCVRRSVRFVSLIAPYLLTKGRNRAVLDWGAGSGLTVRQLRDLGIDTWAFEPFGECPLAKGFCYKDKIEAVEGNFRTVLAQEVIEHLEDVKTFFESTFGSSDDLIFTTTIVSGRVSRDWWYLLPETGQHISFLSSEGIGYICSELSLHYCRSADRSVHLLTKRKRNVLLFRIMTNRFVALLVMTTFKCYIYAAGKLGRAFQERDFDIIAKRLPRNE